MQNFSEKPPFMRRRWVTACAVLALAVAVAAPFVLTAGGQHSLSPAAAATRDLWTSEKIKSAIPLDLVVDVDGNGFQRAPNGALVPYGHDAAPQTAAIPALQQQAQPEGADAVTPLDAPSPVARSSSGTDSTGPMVFDAVPKVGTTHGATVTFAATATDPSRISSVTFVIADPTGAPQQFRGTPVGNGRYSVEVSGLTAGSWSYVVVARDRVRGGGNTTTSPPTQFNVSLDGRTNDDGTQVVSNAAWPYGGVAQLASGRLLMEIPNTVNGQIVGWRATICSGTVVTDTHSGASVILTAAHCVYDSVGKHFARNVIFVPNQTQTTASESDYDCHNDPSGCWLISHGVVDANWARGVFPDNVAWDYGFYVVTNSPDAHLGNGPHRALESAVDPMPVLFNHNPVAERSVALGYSFNADPALRYCADKVGALPDGGNWFLPSCGLTGGASGGPWLQQFDPATGDGVAVSVSSWGFSHRPGMAGPMLDRSAECVFAAANDERRRPVDGGVIVTGCVG